RSADAGRRRARSHGVAAGPAHRFAAQPRNSVRQADATPRARAPRARGDAAGARALVMIRGTTALIAHIGYPTHTFKAPLVYNPYFEHAGIDAVVVPMACEASPYPAFLKALFSLRNIIGALITMPHKVTTVALLQEATPAVKIAGSCNAVRRGRDGRLQGDLFDGEGFVRGVRRKGVNIAGARALIVGAGGVGAAIAASLAAAGVSGLTLYDVRDEVA